MKVKRKSEIIKLVNNRSVSVNCNWESPDNTTGNLFLKGLVTSLAMVLLIAGCSSPSYYGDVSPRYIPIAEKQKEGSVGMIEFAPWIYAVSNITYKNKNGLSLLDAWRQTLRSAIAGTQLFNNSNVIEYYIEVMIKDIAVPEGFATSPVTITASYKISNMDNIDNFILEKTISSTGEAEKKLIDGSKRIRSAYQNAVRVNIELFIDELLKNSEIF